MYNKNFGQKCQKNENFKFPPKLPYFVPLLPFLYFLHINMFFIHIRAILFKLTLLNVRYPFFKANFIKIWNFGLKIGKKVNFWIRTTLVSWTFFSFYPFFMLCMGKYSTSMLLFSPIKILKKKGKKRVL